MNWQAEDACVDDDLHRYFSAWNGRNWTDVANEARRIYNLMFAEQAEEYSPVDALLHAVAAQAAVGAFTAVGAALGIDPDELEQAVYPWYWDMEPGGVDPDAVGLRKLGFFDLE